MSSEVIYNGFAHVANRLEVATQEYIMAKKHCREVLRYRDSTNPEHQKRFQDALERQSVAREQYLEALSAR
jgi:hypothetical protein